MLAFEHVDFEIVAARVLADDHAAVHLDARLDHHRPAVFQLPHRVGDGITLIVGNEHAVASAFDVALVRRVAVEQPVHDRGAARVGEQLALIADQAARRREEHEPRAMSA